MVASIAGTYYKANRTQEYDPTDRKYESRTPHRLQECVQHPEHTRITSH